MIRGMRDSHCSVIINILYENEINAFIVVTISTETM